LEQKSDQPPADNNSDSAPKDQSHWRIAARQIQRHPRYQAAQSAVRATTQLVPNTWRMATHSWRELPSAVIVGAQKAGTTQLYSCLVRHPRCFGGVKKELQYFSKLANRPLGWYQAQFPLSRTVARVGGLCIEASPSYLPSPAALRLMHDVLPSARIIVLLRDPVERAFSHYQHYKTRHRESREFGRAVRDAIHENTERFGRDPWLHGASAPLLDYVARGYYALQLGLLWNLYPRNQVLVIDSADLFEDTNGVCQRVFDFIGLDRRDVSPSKIYNRGYYREKIDPATAELLREHYRAHDRRLADVTGQTFRWMERHGANRLAG
jgi:hypothetical protein